MTLEHEIRLLYCYRALLLEHPCGWTGYYHYTSSWMHYLDIEIPKYCPLVGNYCYVDLHAQCCVVTHTITVTKPLGTMIYLYRSLLQLVSQALH